MKTKFSALALGFVIAAVLTTSSVLEAHTDHELHEDAEVASFSLVQSFEQLYAASSDVASIGTAPIQQLSETLGGDSTKQVSCRGDRCLLDLTWPDENTARQDFEAIAKTLMRQPCEVHSFGSASRVRVGDAVTQRIYFICGAEQP